MSCLLLVKMNERIPEKGILHGMVVDVRRKRAPWGRKEIKNFARFKVNGVKKEDLDYLLDMKISAVHVEPTDIGPRKYYIDLDEIQTKYDDHSEEGHDTCTGCENYFANVINMDYEELKQFIKER